MTDTSRDPETEADSFDPARGGYNVTWEKHCAILTERDHYKARAEWAEAALRKLDRRMDTLDTFDAAVNEIVTEALRALAEGDS